MRIGADPNATESFADAMITSRWRKLAKHRSVPQGLSEGRNEDIMQLVDRTRRSPILKGTLWVIQSGNVYTPTREHLRWGYVASCPLCGATMGTWEHYIDECTGASRPPEHDISPPAVKYTGNFPKHWVEPTLNLEIQLGLTETHRDCDKGAPARYVGTDVSCRNGPGGSRAGWGVYWGACDPHNANGASPGRKQTAGRAEVWAAVQAMMQASTPIFLITDSMEVYSKGNQIVSGRIPAGDMQIYGARACRVAKNFEASTGSKRISARMRLLGAPRPAGTLFGTTTTARTPWRSKASGCTPKILKPGLCDNGSCNAYINMSDTSLMCISKSGSNHATGSLKVVPFGSTLAQFGTI